MYRDAFSAYSPPVFPPLPPSALSRRSPCPQHSRLSCMQAFLEEDVSCPEDFPPSAVAPGLRDLDEALRCPICKDLYKGPVTISCGHGFCSLCIRHELSLRSKQYCPVCRAPAIESHIRRNTKMEDTVQAWTIARPLILKLVKVANAGPPPCTPPTTNGSGTSSGQTSPKKRKRSPLSDNDDVVEITASQMKGQNLVGKGKQLQNRGAPPKDIAETACPICSKVVPLKTINEHIDSGCVKYSTTVTQSKQKQKEGWVTLFSATEGSSSGKGKSKEQAETVRPIPKASYDTLKLKRLKEMLQEYDLPLTGEREQLEARHQHWVILFNANLDSSQRKSLGQLRRDLAAWERADQGKKPIVTDAKTYERQNRKVYAELVIKAKASAPAKPRPKDQLASPSTTAGGPSDSGSSSASKEPHEVMDVDSS
ncbi:hypothetical protein BXZ70DRAFT_927316 [Cristinia sonorae]|uniref:Postreplication repair E3 ubiquitin-protein ligase RAD18 n=1 Tax=Cristinia sonorae TaxID=1940300 RepID=A0A8K0XS17_9AGAR|nr:hypothetical protein BXZ70DRAFT_927316 [Cristinia sonorae]